MEGEMLQGKWEVQEQCLHINLLEMRAVSKALQEFPIPQNASVLVSLDTVVSYINRERGTGSLSLWKETESLFQLVAKLLISLRAVHIPGKMNIIAYLLSCQDQPGGS